MGTALRLDLVVSRPADSDAHPSWAAVRVDHASCRSSIAVTGGTPDLRCGDCVCLCAAGAAPRGLAVARPARGRTRGAPPPPGRHTRAGVMAVCPGPRFTPAHFAELT